MASEPIRRSPQKSSFELQNGLEMLGRAGNLRKNQPAILRTANLACLAKLGGRCRYWCSRHDKNFFLVFLKYITKGEGLNVAVPQAAIASVAGKWSEDPRFLRGDRCRWLNRLSESKSKDEDSVIIFPVIAGCHICI
ncbi:hypothetical protein CBL_07488 [Carabus blaptoides fortunei]